MSQDIFNQRIARITGHVGYGKAEISLVEGSATSIFSSPSTFIGSASVRRNIKLMLMGAVLGMVVGTVAAGLENPAMPWGPDFAYTHMLVGPVLLALCAGPVLAVVGCILRNRFPGFFLSAAAYFPCVIGAALLDLPLY